MDTEWLKPGVLFRTPYSKSVYKCVSVTGIEVAANVAIGFRFTDNPYVWWTSEAIPINMDTEPQEIQEAIMCYLLGGV